MFAHASQFGKSLDRFIEHWIGWSFPPPHQAEQQAGWRVDDFSDYCMRCGDSVGMGEANASGCATCRDGGELARGIGDGVVRLGPHVDVLREWVLAVKFSRWSEMGEHLGRLLGQAVRRSELVDIDSAIVVPMPMPWQRRFYRGIDHARVIAEAAAREIKAPVVSMLRKSHRPPQVSLAPSERKRSGSKGMMLRRRLARSSIAGLDVVLVDDVRTTGASLRAAVRLLRLLKPRRIVCAVVAVSDARARKARTSLALDSMGRVAEPTDDGVGRGMEAKISRL